MNGLNDDDQPATELKDEIAALPLKKKITESTESLVNSSSKVLTMRVCLSRSPSRSKILRLFVLNF